MEKYNEKKKSNVSEKFHGFHSIEFHGIFHGNLNGIPWKIP
jgi:hypothetical protein